MKVLITICLVLISIDLQAQSLSIFDIDTTNFPTMKAKFFAFNKDGNQITNLTPSDFEIKEDGIERKVLNVSCPIPEPPRKVSVLFSFNSSFTMNSKDFGFSYLDMAKMTALEIINNLELNTSELAVQSTSGSPFLNQDFTTDYSKVISAIDKMEPKAGFNYDNHFTLKSSSAINVLKNGKYKKILIFFTNYELYQLNYNYLLNLKDSCLKYDIEFYTVLIGKTYNYKNGNGVSYQELADYTNGMLYKDVISDVNAKDIGYNLHKTFLRFTPCQIEWESSYSCNNQNISLELNYLSKNLNSKNVFLYPTSSIIKLEFMPPFVNFINPKISQLNEVKVLLKTKNSPLHVLDIISSNDAFSISPNNLSLNPNDSLELLVRYIPSDSSYNFSNFEFINQQCLLNYKVSGGWIGKKNENPTIKITQPDSSNVLIVGSDTLIKWDGVLESDNVSLDFTNDGGKSWIKIDEKATGLKYLWKNIPSPPSSHCKLKIKQENKNTLNGNPGSLQYKLGGHSRLVEKVFWSPDGDKIASLSEDKTVIIWNPYGNIIYQFHKLNNIPIDLSWNYDGSKLAIGTDSGFVYIWKANNQDTITKLNYKSNPIWRVKWSPDGQRIAAFHSNGFDLLDNLTGNRAYGVTFRTSYEASFDWSDDGERLAAANNEGKMYIFNAKDGKTLFTIDVKPHFIRYIKFGPDAKMIAAITEGALLVWDIENKELINEFAISDAFFSDFDWNADGNKIATSHHDKTCKIWDLKSGKVIHNLLGHDFFVNKVSWSHDDKKLISLGADYIGIIWDVVTGNIIQKLQGHRHSVNCVDWNNDGSMIVTGSTDSSLIVWETKSGKIINNLFGHANFPEYVYWSTDGSMLLSSGGDYRGIIWDANTGRYLKDFRNKSLTLHINWSPDNKKIATSSLDRTCKIWDVESGLLKSILNDSSIVINYIKWSPNGKRILTSGRNGVCIIWDDSSSRKLFTLQGHKGEINDIDWSHDGNRFVSGCMDSSAIIWDANNGNLLYKLKEHKNKVIKSKFSPDGSKVITSSYDSLAIIWDVSNGSVLNILKGHNHIVYDAKFSPDGSKIATVSLDSTVIIWDAFSGEILKKFLGHKGRIFNCEWNPKGNLLATSASDKYTIIWEVDKDSLLFKLPNNSQAFYHLNWSPDGRRLLTPGENNSIKTWIIDTYSTIIQEAESDVFSVVEPLPTSKDIDLKKCLVGSVKDSLVQNFVVNSGSWRFRVDSIYFRGADAATFSLVSGLPKYELNEKEAKNTELRFSPKKVGIHQAEIVIITQSDTLIQKISGEGVAPELAVNSNWLDFGKVPLKYSKTISDTILITNISQKEIKIDSIGNIGPDATQFIILDDTKAFTLQSNESKKLNIKFEPKEVGRTSGQVAFFYNNFSSPAIVQLFGEGIDIKPKLNSNNPVCEGERIMLFADSIDGAKFFWTGPNNFKSTEQNPIIDDANNSHIGYYSASVIYDIYSSDTSNIDVMVGKFDISPGDSSLIFLGSAERRGISIQLTYPRVFDAGSIWLKNKFSVLNDFSTSFQFITGNGNNNGMDDGSIPGADGFALVFQNNNYPIEGARGGSIGYTGIPKSLAIEIDLFNNDWDENGNHIAVQSLKTEGNQPYHNNSTSCLGINQNILEIKHGKYYFCKVDYIFKEKELKIYIDSTGKFDEVSLIVPNIDFSDYLQLDGKDHVFIGITSATGNAFQNHNILNWRFPCKNIILSQDEVTRIIPLKNELMIYPNPASNNLNIIYSLNKQSDIQFKIINNLGIEMLTEEIIKNQEIGQYNYQINIDELPQGIYHCILKTNTEQLTEMFFKID